MSAETSTIGLGLVLIHPIDKLDICVYSDNCCILYLKQYSDCTIDYYFACKMRIHFSLLIKLSEVSIGLK